MTPSASRESVADQPTSNPRKWPMELLFILTVFATWIVLQIWVLPRFGIRT